MNLEAMLATAEDFSRTREEALWAAEVAGLLGAAPRLGRAARTTVLTVLDSLAADPGRPPAERADVVELREALTGTTRAVA